MTEQIAPDARADLEREAHLAAGYNQVVYFLHAPIAGLVKIGYSWFLSKRAGEIQALCPVRLELIGVMAGAREKEAEIHRQFAHLRVHGEWFRLDDELSEFIGFQSIAYAWNRASPKARARAAKLIIEAAADGFRDIDLDAI